MKAQHRHDYAYDPKDFPQSERQQYQKEYDEQKAVGTVFRVTQKAYCASTEFRPRACTWGWELIDKDGTTLLVSVPWFRRAFDAKKAYWNLIRFHHQYDWSVYSRYGQVRWRISRHKRPNLAVIAIGGVTVRTEPWAEPPKFREALENMAHVQEIVFACHNAHFARIVHRDDEEVRAERGARRFVAGRERGHAPRLPKHARLFEESNVIPRS